ncbi:MULTISPECIES: twin-arginine translocase subunit TatC [unclassified Pseudactinotalea]|uniref:twin-arginine translocase subunit TatC n=1 Tax=unclassified Pseudactinotalea TaxID=2649176 RepID=UPI00128E4A23|nr:MULTISPECIES: twin-arginine translocase subunit TatC [unclassified Pseudactinotalea]MPV49309.1 twin-arginine translocase subunit TatC [Pseudactinotalea sp. HY160]QGH69396.1 twin-arginine translocase subunit TatC [Pseudactinotalea sp. HY158]
MALGDHLRELRRRFMLGAIGLVVGAVIGWLAFDLVFAILQEPFDKLNDRGLVAKLNFTAIASSFDLKIRISLFVGTLVSAPWWLYQMWAFITPGLTKKERRRTIAVVAAGVPLFLAGATMAWLVLPKAVAILTQFTPEGVVNFIDANVYLKFVMQFVLAFGAAFLMPLFMVVLSAMGIVKGRTWLRGWRWAILAIFLFCAIATPTTDVVSMFIMASPIIALYFIAVFFSVRQDKRIAKRRAALDAELAAEDESAGSAGSGEPAETIGANPADVTDRSR